MAISNVDTYIFDLDNTLYDAEDYIFPKLRLMEAELLKLFFSSSTDEMQMIKREYVDQFGSVFEGLRSEKNLHPSEYMNYVHNIDVSPLKPCSTLNNTIKRLNGRKLIFTNGPKHFAKAVLKQIDMLDIFEEIHSIEDAGYIPKPRIGAYNSFISTKNIETKNSCFFEDSIENLEHAHNLGITTIYINKKHKKDLGTKPCFVDHCTSSLNDFLETIM